MAKILIVDDSLVMRKNLEYIIKGAGHEIAGQAINGKQAVAMYSELKPDLVTMDISMPIMTGVEAVAQIVHGEPKAKVVMISALNQKQMVFEALKNGAKQYILKPIDTENVLSVINEVLADNEIAE
jgi:two-component system chemotaxis response regulator CheY